MVVSLKSGSFTANSGSWTPARYCYGISTSKTVARSWMTALSASKASSMPPAESYVVSSTPPESIDFTHRFPRRSAFWKEIDNEGWGKGLIVSMSMPRVM